LGVSSTRFFNRIATVEDFTVELRAGRVEPLRGFPFHTRKDPT
jgi:hypothetical protein